MAILSRWVPVTMVDIRPIDVSLEGLSFMKGSILDLPFADNSIESLSSLCVVEHIGLGRYGDDLDPRGSEKAIAELKRVLRPGGNLLLSVPVDRECRVYFNAHRAFTPDYLMRLLDGMTVVEQRYQYGHALYETYMPERGFGTGLFHLRKRAE
jgi:SAM-dependent methyltransferase